MLNPNDLISLFEKENLALSFVQAEQLDRSLQKMTLEIQNDAGLDPQKIQLEHYGERLKQYKEGIEESCSQLQTLEEAEQRLSRQLSALSLEKKDLEEKTDQCSRNLQELAGAGEQVAFDIFRFDENGK